MTHAEILAKAEAWRRDGLSRPEQSDFMGHLKACPACREMIENWPKAVPMEGLAFRVMARLSTRTDAPIRHRSLRIAPLAAGLAAVLLIVAAFWHPERKWLEEDKFFARFDHHGVEKALSNNKENFYE